MELIWMKNSCKIDLFLSPREHWSIPIPKRNVLSVACQFYGPTGLAAPLMFSVCSLLSDIYRDHQCLMNSVLSEDPDFFHVHWRLWNCSQSDCQERSCGSSNLLWHKSPIFYGTRVIEIAALTNSDNWFWCLGQLNPADLLTRSGSTLEQINSDFWLHGS